MDPSSSEQPQTSQETTAKSEKFRLRKFPVFYGNKSLDNTRFVLTTPFSGKEWRSNNINRLLEAFFAQHTNKNEPMELELIANTGHALYSGIHYEDTNFFDFKNVPDDKKEIVKREFDNLSAANSFLRKVIDAQKLAMDLSALGPLSQSKKAALKKDINEIVSSETDLERQKILIKAIAKFNTHSLLLVDLSKTSLLETEYREESIATLRTIGVDAAVARHKRKDLIIGLYDADTVPADNKTLTNIIDTFVDNRQFLLTNLGYRLPGEPLDVAVNSPDTRREEGGSYNDRIGFKGSPQIYFTKKAYEEKIRAIVDLGLSKGEDNDTAFRLFFHYMSQDKITNATPVNLTYIREEGTLDKLGGLTKQSPDEPIDPIRDAAVFEKREKVEKLIGHLDPKLSEQIRNELTKVRSIYEEQMKKMAKFSRVTLIGFINAIDRGHISLNNGELNIDSAKILASLSGTALTNYINANPQLVKDILNDPNKVNTLKFIAGSVPFPKGWRPKTRFDWAAREYFGKYATIEQIMTLDEHKENSFFQMIETKNENGFVYNKIREKEEIPVDQSTYFALNAETFALNHIYEKYFAVPDYLESLKEQYLHLGPSERLVIDEEDEKLVQKESLEKRLKDIQSKMFIT